MFKTTAIYEVNRTSTKKISINQGGTSSGKTYAIIQLLFTLAVEKSNQVITVAASSVPNLKKGAFRDACMIYSQSNELKKWFNEPTKTDRVFTSTNGSIIEFSSFSSIEDAKPGKRDYLFINEATNIPYDIAWQLIIRTRKKVFIDYNPNARFWVHEHILHRKDAELFISNHKHNCFLPQELHDEIESIEDEQLYRVYGLGLTGIILGVVYDNWIICNEMPVDYKREWLAIDFGYTNDPTAILHIMLSNGELWINELAYERGLKNKDIYDIIDECNLTHLVTVADSAEPKSIDELYNYGIKRIEGAKKGADSIRKGIETVQSYRLNITKNSTGLRKEIISYCWKKDRYTGRTLNEPIDVMNHSLDALRYVALNYLAKKREPSSRTITLSKMKIKR